MTVHYHRLQAVSLSHTAIDEAAEHFTAMTKYSLFLNQYNTYVPMQLIMCYLKQ